MLDGHHATTFLPHQNTSLLNVFSTNITQTSLMAFLLQIQELLDKDRNLDESNVGASGMRGLENQDCEDNKIPPHLSAFEQPI